MSTNLRTSSLELDWDQQADRSSRYAAFAGNTSPAYSRNSASQSGVVVVFPPLSRITAFSSYRVKNAVRPKVKPYDFVKRALDLIGAAVLLIALAPIMAAIYVAIKMNSHGPVVFSQERLTVGGKIFTMFKFRTMKNDAESDTGAVWASKADPRVTTVGKYLRLCRLDELPQLYNVLRGEMSLIGPRPERPEIATDLSVDLPSFNHRLAVKAGITGLAQTTTGYASSVDSYRKKLAWDILYVRNRCLLLDLRIALKTIVVVLTGSGAR